MRHARFTSLAACQAYQAALDVFWGFPRGPQFWNQHFGDIISNITAQADPLHEDARWAIDISCGAAPAGSDYNNTSLFVKAMDPVVLAVVPFPAEAEDYDLEPNDPVWLQPDPV
ncbi:MAG: hypothetical protein ACMG6S_09505 [Byssovorax sp.]